MLQDNISKTADEEKDKLLLENQAAQLPVLKPRLNYYVFMTRHIYEVMIQKAYPKEAIRYMIGILSEVNGNGEIIDLDSRSVLFNILKDKFGPDIAKRSTFFEWISQFIKDGLITYSKTERKLAIVNYRESFKKGSKGTFQIPSFMFESGFKKKSVTAHRLALIWASRMGKDAYAGFGLLKGKNQSEYEALKRRCPAEVEAAMEELKEYYDVEKYASGFTFRIRLLDKYFMKQKDQMQIATLKGEKQPACYMCKKTWDKVLEWSYKNGLYGLLEVRAMENKDNADYEDLDVYSSLSTISKLLHRYRKKSVYILQQFKQVLESMKQPIKSIGGFIQTLIDVHILNKPSELRDLKSVEKLISRLKEQGIPLDAFPMIKEKYNYLLKAASNI